MPEKIYLTPEQVRALKNLDSIIAHTREEIERAKKLGLDMSILENELNRAVALRDKLLEEYSPPESK